MTSQRRDIPGPVLLLRFSISKLANEATLRSYAYSDGALRNGEVVRAMGMLKSLSRPWGSFRAVANQRGAEASERGVDVYAQDMKGKSVEVLVRWWAGSRPHDMRATRDAIIRKVRAAIAALPDRLGETA